MAVIEFRTLGALDLRADGHHLHSLLAQPKRVALLAYLCVASPRGFHRRDTLLGLFWPESDESHARTSLRNALHVLRHSLGETALLSRGDEEVGVNSGLVWCDAAAFEQEAGSDSIEHAIDLYRGDFLTGFFVDDAPAFERWVESERTRLRSLAARAARVAAERREKDHNLTDAISLARRAVELSDTDERAVRRLVELLARAGDRAGALEAYNKFARQVALQFDAEPSPDTRAVVERIRRQQSPVASSAGVSAPTEAQAIERQAHTGPTIPGYAIERELGRGGMAIVFLARDLKHDRAVAIKMLRPEVAALVGTDRFLAEIAIASRLNHPHILALLDSGNANALPYYVMRHVEGETLRNRLRREKFLPIDDAIRIACQVADAISYANGCGIIHRDIKPDNILLENDHVLVSDFGIARAISQAAGQRITQTGLVVGTAPYMSPEQADESIAVDARADQYALACVLYEMLTGDPPFPGSTSQAILSRKAAEPAPPLRTVRNTIPPRVEWSVLKALSRAPSDRFRTVKDFADALHLSGVNQPGLIRRAISPRSIALGLVLLLVVAAMTRVRTSLGGSRIGPPVRHKLTTTGDAMMASLSPDGQFLAYVTHAGDSERVMMQDMAGGSPTTITTMTPVVWSLEWAPDGTRLLMGGTARALLLPRLGGQRTPIGPKAGGQVLAYWLPDSTRFSVHDAGDRRVLVFNPKTQDTVSLPVAGNYTWLLEGSWAPTGRVFAVMTQTGDPVSWEIRTVTFDGRTELLVQDSVQLGSPRWSRDGNELYYTRGSDALWRVGVSPLSGKIRGTSEAVADDLELYAQRFGLVHFALTANGKAMLYARGARFSNVWLVERVNGQAQPRVTTLTRGTFLRWSPVASPDEESIAFAQQLDNGAELFTMPISGGNPVQITSGAKVRAESQIAWSRDGTRIAFSSVRNGHAQVWIASVVDGRMQGFDKTRMSTATGHLTWAPGNGIVYQRPDHQSVGLIDPISGDERTVIQDSAIGAIHSPSYSPDGKRLAAFWFRGNVDKPAGVYVFDVARSTSRWVGEGLYPRGWSPDSRYVYFQWPQSPIIYRLDARGGKKADVFLTPPFREAECSPVGATRPNSFVCAVFDFVSDIWRIDNFDQRAN